MDIDEDVLMALKRAIVALEEEPDRPVPTGLLAPLMGVARPGLRLRVDVEASKHIGAPLISIVTGNDPSRLFASLTPRQTEVAKLIIEGLPNRRIAEQLGISLATVKDHVHAILRRLNFPSRSALISAVRSCD